MNIITPPSVLVVEDDEMIQQTLVDMLEINNYAVRTASSAEQGLLFATNHHTDIILTDLGLSGMSGLDFIKKLRSEEALRNIPIIVISARADREPVREAMNLGADDYITKPFTEHEVIRSIQTRLEKKELVAELDAFAHTVAHDLNNPIAAVRGRLELLDLFIGKKDEAVLRQQVAQASAAANRLSEIIKELLILAGVRRQRVNPEMLNHAAIVAECLARLENLLQGSGARVDQGQPETWPVAYGHAPWVVHLWTNYVSNAAKYGGPNAKITLGAEARADGERVRFWVQDCGPGIGQAAVSAIFVPFASISTVRADGHGLGLSIVRRIAEKLGGQVGAENVTGGGARFWFELPAAPVPSAPKNSRA